MIESLSLSLNFFKYSCNSCHFSSAVLLCHTVFPHIQVCPSGNVALPSVKELNGWLFAPSKTCLPCISQHIIKFLNNIFLKMFLLVSLCTERTLLQSQDIHHPNRLSSAR